MEFNDESLVPDIYTDAMGIGHNVYGFTLDFAAHTGQAPNPKLQARVRMSPQHAKIMALLLRRNVQQYEREVGTIILPESLYNELGINDDMAGD